MQRQQTPKTSSKVKVNDLEIDIHTRQVKRADKIISLSNREFMLPEHEINRLQDIVQQFLLISQLKHSGLKLISSEVDLSEQILRVFARNNLLLKQQKLQTAIIFDEQMPSCLILADRDKLEIVWQNLLQNAIRYGRTKYHGQMPCTAGKRPNIYLF